MTSVTANHDLNGDGKTDLRVRYEERQVDGATDRRVWITTWTDADGDGRRERHDTFVHDANSDGNAETVSTSTETTNGYGTKVETTTTVDDTDSDGTPDRVTESEIRRRGDGEESHTEVDEGADGDVDSTRHSRCSWGDGSMTVHTVEDTDGDGRPDHDTTTIWVDTNLDGNPNADGRWDWERWDRDRDGWWEPPVHPEDEPRGDYTPPDDHPHVRGFPEPGGDGGWAIPRDGHSQPGRPVWGLPPAPRVPDPAPAPDPRPIELRPIGVVPSDPEPVGVVPSEPAEVAVVPVVAEVPAEEVADVAVAEVEDPVEVVAGVEPAFDAAETAVPVIDEPVVELPAEAQLSTMHAFDLELDLAPEFTPLLPALELLDPAGLEVEAAALELLG